MDNKLSIDEKFLKKLVDLLETNLEKEHFGVGELASAMGLSRSQLHRKLNTIEGKSTSQYIREFRLKRAMEMLQNNVATASEIAYKVGFSSPTYFNTSFHQYYGYPPGEVKFRNPLIEEEREKIVISTNQPISATSKNLLFSPRTFLLAPLAILLILGFGWYSFKNSDPAITTDSNISAIISENSIAVLPFKNMSGSSKNEAFCDGMTAAIISRLSKIKGINEVVSQTSMMNFKNSDKSIKEIAEELKVRYVLESGFQKSGNDIKINVQLIDGRKDQLFWSQEYGGTYDSIFLVQAQVAEMVAKKLDANIKEEEQKEIQLAMTTNMEAYENYLQGLSVGCSGTENKIIASRIYFERAIKLDSSFAEAYLKLGDTYSHLGTWLGSLSRKEADSLAEPYYSKAFELDPHNPDLLFRLAEKEFLSWNFERAEIMLNEYNRYQENSFVLRFLNLLLGRYDRVIESINNIAKEDPNVLYSDFTIVYAYYFTGEIETSLELMNKALYLYPEYGSIYDHIGNMHLALGKYEKAKDLLETGLQLSEKRHASMVIHLAIAYHFLGNGDKSLQYLNEVIDRARLGEAEINVFVAHYYARLGNNDEAFKWLEKAYEKHEVDLIWLQADPNLLMLKNDPRYKVLCSKVGFPKI